MGRGDRETRGRALRGTFSASPWVEDDGGDRWRTAALQLGYKDFQAGFEIYTGDPENEAEERPRKDLQIDGKKVPVYSGGTANQIRMGPAYVGLRNDGRVYRAGAEGEPIRGFIQNNFHSFLRSVFGSDAARFRVMGNDIEPYSRVNSPRGFTLY
jgi:hypothetical protein